MATDNNIIREGIVSTVDPETMTATVIFPDKDNTVSGPLKIGTQGSREDKMAWLPLPGDPVACVMKQNNTTSLNQGFIICTFFNEQNKPPDDIGTGKRILNFGDGTKTTYDKNSHELRIDCVGKIYINGSEIHLNE